MSKNNSKNAYKSEFNDIVISGKTVKAAATVLMVMHFVVATFCLCLALAGVYKGVVIPAMLFNIVALVLWVQPLSRGIQSSNEK